MTWKERRIVTILTTIVLVLAAALLIVLGIRFREWRAAQQADPAGAPADGTAADETSENTSDESEGVEIRKNSDDNVGSEDNAVNTDGDTSDDEDIGA